MISKENILHQTSLDIHDFQGHMSLNGGTYRMPFSVEIPYDAAPSFEISPVEKSLLEVAYTIGAMITEINDINPVLIKSSSKV